jgi:hypothetical protein
MRKIFSFDAETNGLWGQAFAIGALVYDENGTEIARFVGRLPDTEVTDEWVRENVLSQLTAVPVTHSDYESLLADFAKFYLANKADADIVVHMGVPVESKVLIDMHARRLIGDWDGPYPLHDVAGYLAQAGEDPASVDGYVRKYGLVIAGDFAGGSHNPLYDSEVATRVLIHLRNR